MRIIKQWFMNQLRNHNFSDFKKKEEKYLSPNSSDEPFLVSHSGRTSGTFPNSTGNIVVNGSPKKVAFDPVRHFACGQMFSGRFVGVRPLQDFLFLPRPYENPFWMSNVVMKCAI
jgi:hypothetical protein